jgi:hypothetical protein
MPLPDTSEEREQAAEFTHSVLVFPPTKRTVVRCVVKIKHGEDARHLVEVIFGLTATLFKLDAEQNQCDLRPLGGPVRAIRRGGYVRLINLLFGKVSAHLGKPSERYHIARQRPIPG